MGKDLGNPASHGGRIRNKSDALMDAISKNLPWARFGGSRSSYPKDLLNAIMTIGGFNKGGLVSRNRKKKCKKF
jgi:hypothetical protein